MAKKFIDQNALRRIMTTSSEKEIDYGSFWYCNDTRHNLSAPQYALRARAILAGAFSGMTDAGTRLKLQLYGPLTPFGGPYVRKLITFYVALAPEVKIIPTNIVQITFQGEEPLTVAPPSPRPIPRR